MLVKRLSVAVQPALVFEATLDEIEGDLRQTPLCHAVQVFDIDGLIHSHRAGFSLQSAYAAQLLRIDRRDGNSDSAGLGCGSRPVCREPDQRLRCQSSVHRKSGPSWSRLGQPIWPMTRSISPLKMSIAFLTPGRPPAAAPYSVGRPMKQKSAPRHSAINMSAPRRTPPSKRIVILSPTAALIAGSTSSEPGA